MIDTKKNITRINSSMDSRETEELSQKFERLIESLKNSTKNNREKKGISQLEENILDFQLYLKKKNIHLTEFEKRELMIINGSKFQPLIKKRMTEDLFHKVKSRVEKEKDILKNKKKIEAEIEEISTPQFFLKKWLDLTNFSLNYGTISPLSHKFKRLTLDIIIKDGLIRIENISKKVIPFLNNKYYLFSNIEYNSLKKLIFISSNIEALSKIPFQKKYQPSTIKNIFNSFTEEYLSLLVNSQKLEKAIQKIRKNLDNEGGLWGNYKFFMGEPIRGNKTLQKNKNYVISKTILGSILSFYTAKEKVLINTINQVMYLTDCDGKIDSKEKHLTEKAIEVEKQNRNRHEDEHETLLKRYNNLKLITKSLLPLGEDLEDSMLKIETNTEFNNVKNNYKKNPLLRIKKLTEYFIKYFIEDVIKEENFILKYEEETFNNFFSNFKDVNEIAKSYNLTEFDLVGGKIKDFLNTINFLNATNNKEKNDTTNIIELLTQDDGKISKTDPKFNFARTILLRISERSYELGKSLFEIIRFYNENKDLYYKKKYKNYDFFTNARLTRSKHIKSPIIFFRDSITLKEFIEAAASISFFIAFLLNHTGLVAMVKERDLTKEKLDELEQKKIIIEKDGEMQNEITDIEDDSFIYDELNRLHVDTLTGLYKKEYFDDLLLSIFYDDKNNAIVEDERIIFIAKIIDLPLYNSVLSREAGNQIVKFVAGRLNNFTTEKFSNKNNILIRYTGEIFLGFIFETKIDSFIKGIKNLCDEIFNSSIDIERDTVKEIGINAAILVEKKGDNFENSEETLTNLLLKIPKNEKKKIVILYNGQEKII